MVVQQLWSVAATKRFIVHRVSKEYHVKHVVFSVAEFYS